MAGGCGACRAGDNPTSCNLDESVYRIRSGSRVMGGAWSQASFPSIPCPSPQVIRWQARLPGGSWTAISTSSGSALGVRLESGSSTQSAVAGVTYNRNIFFTGTAVGKIMELRILMACGTAFKSATRFVAVTRPITNVS